MTSSRLPAAPKTLNPYQLQTGRWPLVIGSCMVGLLAFMPVAYGAVEAWSELFALAFAALISALLAIWAFYDREVQLNPAWLLLPLAGFVLLCALQLTPLPPHVLAWLSPSTAEIKQVMLSDLSTPVNSMTISFYPLETAHLLRLFLIGVIMFLGASLTFRSERRVQWLLTAVFAIGCAEGALALAQIATEAKSIFWLPTSSGGRTVTSGSFVNYSHFCQFMNLSLGAGLGLLLMRLHRERRTAGREPAPLRAVLELCQAHGVVIGGLVLCALAILTSMSRNGAIALAVASAAIGAMLAVRQSLGWKGWTLALIPLGVLSCLLLFRLDAFYERIGSLQQTDAYQERWELTAGTLRAWKDFPIFGAGLGAHEFVFPMYDRAVTPAVAAHADNDYAQLLEETGLIGAALVALFLGMIALTASRLMRHGTSVASQAAYGLAFGLLAIAIQGATDFGQRVPAVFCLSALFCGLLVALSRVESRSANEPNAPAIPNSVHGFRLRGFGTTTCFIGVTLLCTWALRDAYDAYVGETWWSAATRLDRQLLQSAGTADLPDYVDILAAAEGAVAAQPKDIKYRYGLDVYRWRSLSRAVDPDTGRVVLHPDSIGYVARIADDLTAAREICPTYGPTHALEGELRLFVLGDERGAELIRNASKLAAFDPYTCLVAGQLAARDGSLDEAQVLLDRAFALDAGLFPAVVDIYLKLNRPAWARSLAGENYTRMQQLAQMCAAMDQYNELSIEILADAERVIRARIDADTASGHELAAVARAEFDASQYDTSISFYRRALGRDYRQIEWRLQLARGLVKLDRIDDAMHELRICLRLRPGYGPAENLLESLAKLPAGK